MHRLLIFAAVLGLGVIAADAQAPAEPQKSPKEVVEQFYKMETEGRWLGPELWGELQDFLTDVSSWFPPASISVLRSYEVGGARKDIGAGGTVDYQVEVDFFEWGSIDSFLNFTKARGPRGKNPAPGEPVEQRTYQTLVLRDRFLKRTLSGEEEEKKGTLGWRIEVFASPSVDVNAAVRWVSEMRDKSSDPAIKYNAAKTMAILKSLSAGTPLPAQPAGVAKESPSDIARRFVTLESGLLPAQWNELTNFFVETPKPQWNKVHIVDVVYTGVDTNGNSTLVGISTNALGVLDSSVRLSSYPPWRLPLGDSSTSACYGDDRFAFSLLLSDKHWQIATDGTVKELDGPLAWRIEDTSFQPLITLDTAIRYARQVRDKTTDPIVKMNAARTLSILKYYKQGKPLPDELSSGASGGCG
jgi:hypothetical protein